MVPPGEKITKIVGEYKVEEWFKWQKIINIQ
jgi:hypothetical protein